MRLNIASCSYLIFFLIFSSQALAQQRPVAGLGFKLGDSVAQTKAALKVSYAPEPHQPNPNLPPVAREHDPKIGTSFYHLREKGIWVFFDKAQKIYTIRLEAPFKAQIKGIKIGDNMGTLIGRLGEPLKTPWRFGLSLAYLYALDDSAYVRFDMSDDGVQQILIIK